jgi:hypothetical protein
MEKKSIFMPDFPATHSPDEIVDRVRQTLEEKINEFDGEQERDDVIEEATDQIQIQSAPRSENPVYNLALDAISNKVTAFMIIYKQDSFTVNFLI